LHRVRARDPERGDRGCRRPGRSVPARRTPTPWAPTRAASDPPARPRGSTAAPRRPPGDARSPARSRAPAAPTPAHGPWRSRRPRRATPGRPGRPVRGARARRGAVPPSKRRRRRAARAGRPAVPRWPPGPGDAPSPCSPRASGSDPGPTIPAPPGPGCRPGERFGGGGSPHQTTRNNYRYYGYRVETGPSEPDMLLTLYNAGVIVGIVRRVEYPQFTDWMQRLPRDVFVAVEADIRYLLEFGRSAVLPAHGCGFNRVSIFPTWPRREPTSWIRPVAAGSSGHWPCSGPATRCWRSASAETRAPGPTVTRHRTGTTSGCRSPIGYSRR